MKIEIPLSCPKCNGKMYCITYDTILKILKNRMWHICKECNYSRDVDEFKRNLITV